MLWVVIGFIALIFLTVLQRYFLNDKEPLAEEDRTRHIDLKVDLGNFGGCKSIQGARAYMEDTYQCVHPFNGTYSYFAVFDGHGGARVSKFAASRLQELITAHLNNEDDPAEALDLAFRQLDSEWLAVANRMGYDDGSTGVAALLVDDVLYVANVGDSRAVVSCNGIAVDMSHDHKPVREDEKRRIEALGGRIVHHGTWRVEGVLAVSRAFGDRRLKKYVSAAPEIMTRRITPSDRYLILASDGVWDAFSSQTAVDIIGGATSVVDAANRLTAAAYKRGSTDNITSLVIDLTLLAVNT